MGNLYQQHGGLHIVDVVCLAEGCKEPVDGFGQIVVIADSLSIIYSNHIINTAQITVKNR
jgi:uncharacterized protein YdaL